MEKIVIREAKKPDSQDIARIKVKTWQFAYKDQLPKDFLDKLSIEQHAKKWKSFLENPQAKGKIFVAGVQGQLVGFCSVGPSRDSDADETVGELYAIYVDEQIMNKGVGSALMRNALD